MSGKPKGGVREGAGRPAKPGVFISGKISLHSNAQLKKLIERGQEKRPDIVFTRLAAIEWAIHELYVAEFGDEPVEESSEE
jgi:hypothetical protein